MQGATRTLRISQPRAARPRALLTPFPTPFPRPHSICSKGVLDRESLVAARGAGAAGEDGAGGELATGAPSSSAASASWRLTLDVVCTTYDGNVTDAAVLACVVALATTRYPADSGAAPSAAAADLPRGPRLTLLPLALTCARTGVTLVADPSASNGEDAPPATYRTGGASASGRSLATAVVTVTLGCAPAPAAGAGAAAAAAPPCVLAVDLASGPALREEHLMAAVHLATARAEALRKLVLTAVAAAGAAGAAGVGAG